MPAALETRHPEGGLLPDSISLPSTRHLPANSRPSEGRARAIRRTMAARAVRAGNSNALRHGVYSEVAVRADVLDEATLLLARAPWLDPVRDGFLVEATARLLVRLRRLDLVLEAEPTQVLTSLYARLEGQLTRNLDALGLTPQAAARLGLAHLDAKARARHMAQRTLAAYREEDAP